MADRIDEDKAYNETINEALESIDGSEKVYTDVYELISDLYKEFGNNESNNSII